MISYATGISVSLCLMVLMILLMVYESLKEGKVKPVVVTGRQPREFRADFASDMKCLEYTISRMAREQIDRKILSANEYGYTEIQNIDIPMEKDLDKINEYIEEGVELVMAMLSFDMIAKLLLYYSEKGLRAYIRMHFRDLFMIEVNRLRAEREDAMRDEQELIKSGNEAKQKVDNLAKQNDVVKKIANKWGMDYNQMLNVKNTYVNSDLYKNKAKFIKERSKYNYECDVIDIIENLK